MGEKCVFIRIFQHNQSQKRIYISIPWGTFLSHLVYLIFHSLLRRVEGHVSGEVVGALEALGADFALETPLVAMALAHVRTTVR